MGSPNVKSEIIRRTLRLNLKALLAEQQISENQLSQMSGVNQKQINNLTNARTGCGIDVLEAIARALQVPAWVLLVPSLHVNTPALPDIEGCVKRLIVNKA